MEGVKYRMNEELIGQGDILYLYTDGITEAINPGKELYGESRLMELIGSMQEHSVRKMCAGILSDVDLYAGSEPQFDDITMLGFKFGE
jgi:sigma-B regulation protein RsbU (phosphoserine phosphatase)